MKGYWSLSKLSPDICRLERKIELVCIPVSILVMAVFLLQCWQWEGVFVALGESTIGVFVIGIVDRTIIFHFWNKYGNSQYSKRLFWQILLTFLYSTVLVMAMFYGHHQIFKNFPNPQTVPVFLKELITTLFLFTFIVNGIYEILFLFERLNKERLEKERIRESVLEARLENLRNQINPHFLFNTFNALSELIDENPWRASYIVLEISDLYRYVLEVRDKNWMTLDKEMAVANSFIEIVKIRYEENVTISISVDHKYLRWYLPPLAVQMLLENAIKHNEISSTKKLSIRIDTEKDHLVVTNNYQPRINGEKSNGVGLKNIETRYSYLLNKKLDILQNENTFSVKLPLIKKIEEE